MAISLADLVRDLCATRLKKSQTVSDWSARPFSEKQLEYLVDDVAHLLDMQDKLSERLREKGRYEWAIEECRLLSEVERYRSEERRMYSRIPGANRMNRRELGVLSEITKLRDRIARERDLPLKYVMPDDVVGGLATVRPRTLEDLAQLRRLDAGTRRALGPLILEAVKRGEAIDEADLPAKFSRPLGNARETLVSLMSVVVGEIAQENELPPSLLAPRASLERVAREVPTSREDFERVLGLSHWRTQLVAEPLWRLLSGQSLLQIEGYATGDPRISLKS
jgi:ribonuclease D